MEIRARTSQHVGARARGVQLHLLPVTMPLLVSACVNRKGQVWRLKGHETCEDIRLR